MPKKMAEAERLLEDLVDQNGIREVVEVLVNICYEKEDHVAANWGDRNLAKAWHKAAVVLDAATTKLPHPLP